ncbi:DGQHR domain-containing protein [Salegentibacter echinorum]|uniref:DGQHR domain-containing protein n=1 Tax=Salegentibacter echinorum TaxID=1073325 RepID=A0A1M5GCC0_SALEC|nr:DGQHR domain-containing protein [Salegentibacter echinorum]SHG01318.1 DGQHR domain-containing protein [Salegentibacter echinorum]
MNNSEYIEVPFIKIQQPIGTFYVCKMSWQQLIDISYADIRDIDESSKNSEFDDYLGIQRKVSKGRIKEISSYVTNLDATFPTSIILHIRSTSLFHKGELLENYDDQFIQDNESEIEEMTNVKIEDNKIYIRRSEQIAKILDGQHRIEGFRNAIDNGETIEDFDFNVTVFVDLDLDDQAQIFSVINKAQTKVNKSLVYDLYEYAKHRSPQKTAHDIVRVLNKSEKSALYKSVKILGTAKDKELETIAQATLAELIIDSISKQPMVDRNLLRKKSIFNSSGLKKETDRKELERRIFRNLFIEEDDDTIYFIINNFYNAVSRKWSRAWKNYPIIEKNILKKSTGIVALFRFMRYLYNYKNKVDENMSESEFSEQLELIDIPDTQFTTEFYKPGSSGQSQLFKDLVYQHKENYMLD